MKEFLERLSSRKWLLTLAICAYFISQGEPAFSSLTQVVIAFLAIEGGADAFARVSEARILNRASTPPVNQAIEQPYINPSNTDPSNHSPLGD